MAVQILNHAQSFGSGSQLWVMSDDLSAPLNRKIDWYLNFQVTRARQHKSKGLSPQLKTVLNENSLTLSDYEIDTNSPTLILAGRQLPAQFLLVVPLVEGQSDSKKWSKTIHERWLAMNKPAARVFLPSSISAAQFKQGWSDTELEQLTLVPGSNV